MDTASSWITYILLVFALMNTVTGVEINTTKLCSSKSCLEYTKTCYNNSIAQISFNISEFDSGLFRYQIECNNDGYSFTSRVMPHLFPNYSPFTIEPPLQAPNETCSFVVQVSILPRYITTVTSYCTYTDPAYFIATSTSMPQPSMSSQYSLDFLSFTVSSSEDEVWPTLTSLYITTTEEVFPSTDMALELSETTSTIIYSSSILSSLISSYIPSHITSSRSSSSSSSSATSLKSTTPNITIEPSTKSTLITSYIISPSSLSSTTPSPSSISQDINVIIVASAIAILLFVILLICLIFAIICFGLLIRSKKMKVHHIGGKFEGTKGPIDYIHLNIMDTMSISESVVTIEQGLDLTTTIQPFSREYRRQVSLPIIFSPQKTSLVKVLSDQLFSYSESSASESSTTLDNNTKNDNEETIKTIPFNNEEVIISCNSLPPSLPVQSSAVSDYIKTPGPSLPIEGDLGYIQSPLTYTTTSGDEYMLSDDPPNSAISQQSTSSSNNGYVTGDVFPSISLKSTGYVSEDDQPLSIIEYEIDDEYHLSEDTSSNGYLHATSVQEEFQSSGSYYEGGDSSTTSGYISDVQCYDENLQLPSTSYHIKNTPLALIKDNMYNI